MTRDFEASPLFDGYREALAVDRRGVAETIVAVGALLATHEEIREINPLLARLDRSIALDALVSIAEGR